MSKIISPKIGKIYYFKIKDNFSNDKFTGYCKILNMKSKYSYDTNCHIFYMNNEYTNFISEIKPYELFEIKDKKLKKWIELLF